MDRPRRGWGGGQQQGSQAPVARDAHPADVPNQLLREAIAARDLHDLIAVEWPPSMQELVGPFDPTLGGAPDEEPYRTMRKLLRRYPTRQDAEDTIEQLWETSVGQFRLEKLERQLSAAGTMVERRQIARDIDALRTGR
jgi:hypothetical protein